jgi:uncharacterized cupin superfamily protein/RimJ/RimL family protein N-acetyltransferase
MEKCHLPERIESSRIYLKKHSIDLAETMFQYVDEDRERLMRFLPWVKFTAKIQDEVDYIKMTHEKWDRYELYDYGIFSKDKNIYMGNVGIHTISWASDRCEIGYWILGRFEGQGYMSEAAATLTNTAFEMGFNRVEIHCDPENIRSANVPKHLGFCFEARLAQHTKDHNGNSRDSFVFARLKSHGHVACEGKKATKSTRPEFIKHYSEIQEGPESSYYRGTKEFLSIGSPFAKKFGLTRLGIHHELLPPGRRTSWPHAESAEEEFVYVIEGNPDAWINGQIYRLNSGDAVGFPSGTGVSHTFINNTASDVRLLVVGEASKKENKIYYPLNPSRREQCKDTWWNDVPKHDHGPHDGLPDKLRESGPLGPLNYTGEIIVESLQDKSVLELLETYRIKSRRADMSNEQVKVWNINRYCLDEQALTEVLPRLENSISTGGWYIHFYSDIGNKLYVIFKGKHFLVSKTKDSTWDEMIRFGDSIGVERRWTETIPVSFKI